MSTLLLIASLLVQPPAVQSRTGAIAGQILGQNGEPAANVRVMAVEATGGAGAVSVSSLALTDQRGRYRLEAIPPGQYHIIAGALDAPVYFPGTALASRATIVNVAGGSNTPGVDFRLVRTAFTVGGRVTWETTTQPSSARIALTGRRSFGATLSSNGSFEFSNVPAGSYSLGVTESVPAEGRGRGQQRNISRAAPVFPQRVVVGEDDAHLEFRVPTTQEFSGSVTVEGGGPAPRFELLFTGRFTISVPVNRGGFRAPMPPGEYRVSLEGLPPGFRLKSFTNSAPGPSAAAGALTLRIPDAPSIANITLAPGSPDPWVRVSGHVSGAGAAEGLSVVIIETLAVTPDNSGRSITPDVWAAPVNAAGDFEFSRVLPGKYRATLSARPETRLDITTVTPVDVVVSPATDREGGAKNVLIAVPVQKQIRGRVQVQGRGPIPNFWTKLTSSDGNAEAIAHIRPDSEGRFTVTVAAGEHPLDGIEGLPPGYELVSAQYGSTNLDEDSLNVLASDTAEIRVRLKTPGLTPVRVSGRAVNVAPEALSRGQLRATLTSTAYAGTIETNVNSDGSFVFPTVFPGAYMARIDGAGAPTDACAPVVAGKGDVKDVLVSPGKAFEIHSAIYGGDTGSADVTPLVVSQTKPELDAFFAAPAWLLVDPAFGQLKELVVSYQYHCRQFTITTGEPGAISYAILIAHATNVLASELWNGPLITESAVTPQPATPLSGSDLVVLSASYGTGNQYSSVTTKVRELLLSGAPFFTVNDSTFGVNQDNNHRALVLTYVYQGKRAAITVSKGGALSLALLAETAQSGIQADIYSPEPPDWLEEAQPDPPLEPGVRGAGAGQGPRKELGIMALLKALAELQELAPKGDRKVGATIPLVKQAIADAQETIPYLFPPPSMKAPPPGPNAANDARLANAIRNLNTAKAHLGAANPARNGAALARALDAIDQVLTTLQGQAAGRPPGGPF